eukprot:3580175-Pyramimonas_sp.AAC.1
MSQGALLPRNAHGLVVCLLKMLHELLDVQRRPPVWGKLLAVLPDNLDALAPADASGNEKCAC